MERFSFVLIAVLAFCIKSFADGLTATLQQGSTMTPYYGVDALKQAYEAASDGAVITLSSGQFNSVENIEKSIRIVGAYGLSNTSSYATYINGTITIKANNVRLEGMCFPSDITLDAITNCTIKRCWMYTLKQAGTHTNTLIDQCVLQDDFAIAKGVNYGIKNTTIGGFRAMNDSSTVANVTNCCINYFYNYSYSETYTQPLAVYKNNIIRLHTISYNITLTPFTSPSEFYYNYFYQTKETSSARLISYSFAQGCINVGNVGSGGIYSSAGFDYPNTFWYGEGMDGTARGITGGEGFNEYPAIPRVVTATIDAQTDNEGKLNGTLEVKAEQ